MPVSKKRKKEGKTRSRDRREAASSPAPPEEVPAGGLLTRMRGGFQSMAGTGARKKESSLSKIITWGILVLAAYFVARRFGILP